MITRAHPVVQELTAVEVSKLHALNAQQANSALEPDQVDVQAAVHACLGTWNHLLAQQPATDNAKSFVKHAQKISTCLGV